MLPSQSARSNASRSHMYRRTRNRKLPAIIVALLVLAGGGVVFKWWLGSGEPAPANAADPAAANQPVAPPQSNAPPRTDVNRTASNPPRSSALQDQPANRVSMGGSTPERSTANTPTIPSQPKPSSIAAPTNTQTPIEVATLSPEKGIDNRSTPPSVTGTNSTPTAPTSASQPPALANQRLQAGLDLLAQNKPVEARLMLTSALESSNVSVADADRIRTELKKLNQRMVFGPEIMSGDSFASTYVVEPGDSLAKLPRKLGLKVDWRFLQRINNISAPEKLRVGQKIKVIKGPFHAVVHKPDFRLDLFMGESPERVFVTSMMVGLGEYGATPEGEFVVKPNSKLVDPAWTNPRTGEYFASKDPKNPLGKFWLGLLGTSDNIRGLETYGIHGTIEPDSIGEMRSMGCVRLRDDDIALLYEVLLENTSRVAIHGADYP